MQAAGLEFGGRQIILIAGPCAVESREQLLETAEGVRAAGAHMLRGGAFKPRSSPHRWEGMGEEGLALLAEARAATGLPIVTECMGHEQIPAVSAVADIVQIGTRNMMASEFLKAVGRQAKPVLLKRGLAATVQEFVLAVDFIRVGGNEQILLCERGIRTFEDYTRNTLDLAAVPVLKSHTELPVIVDPSHGTFRKELVVPMALAAISAGADGIMIEVHCRPEEALTDGPHSLTIEEFAAAVPRMEAAARGVDRTLGVN